MLSNYFKERKGFDRLFQLLKKKYVSLGRYSGTIILKKVTEEEARELSEFFGMTIKEKEDFKTSFKKIEKVLLETKYKDFTWDCLFYDYFGEEIMDKKQKLKMQEEEQNQFFQSLKGKLTKKEQFFYDEILQNKELYFLLLKRYKKSKENLEKDLISIIKLISFTELKTPISLAVLASMTGNPHFLDFKTANFSLFLRLLAFKEKKELPKTTKEKILFLEEHKIYIDYFSNFVITYHLTSESDMVKVFDQEREPLNLNLSNLEKIETLDTKEKCVFIFENPSMLMALKKISVPIVITYGMPNLVVYKVLEKLVKSGNQLYYNGDFDPEGIFIASLLKKNFPTLQFFCYEKEDYEHAISSEKITSSRLKKLDQIEEEELKSIVNLLRKRKYASYQEKNLDRIETFIRKTISN